MIAILAPLWRRALPWLALAAAILLFILGAPARRPAARQSVSKTSKEPMMRFAGCLKPGLIALGTVTILSSGCTRVASDHAACPPVVEYQAEFQRRAAAEVEALPAGAAIEGMLADYHVLRRQARACNSSPDQPERGVQGSVAAPLIGQRVAIVESGGK